MSVDTPQRRYIIIIAQVIVSALYSGFLAFILITTTDLQYISLSLAYPFPLNLYMVLLYAGVGLGIVTVLNIFFRFTNMVPDRLFVSILLSPLLFLATLLVGHVILMFFLRGLENLFIYSVLTFASLYFSMFAILFIIMDALPNWGKMVLVLWYGGSIGAFLGVAIPTLFLFMLFIALAGIDLFTARAVQPDWHDRVEGFEVLGTLIGGTFMGVGDIVSYAAIVSHSLIYFGAYVALLSTIMLFVGAWVLVWGYKDRIDKPIPGLIVVLFAILPWIPYIIAELLF